MNCLNPILIRLKRQGKFLKDVYKAGNYLEYAEKQKF